MKVKCGRREIILDEKDIIMFNGACYQIITKKIGVGWEATTPIIGKTKAKELIKNGLLKEVKFKNPPYKTESLVYYMI